MILSKRTKDNIYFSTLLELLTKDPETTSKVIQGLEIYTQYLVSVQVVNPEGLGPASTVVVMTDEGGGSVVYQQFVQNISVD